ncbi:aTP-dependent exoDNAse (Exonuclease V) alpha subunit-helicase superfamily I member [Mycoplasma sp. CAG:877]|nr:aTP-dependent exoDNAse (Exonuclease V) alpha subunit-helicase superfamily I member [Mycoplasma sp. CAG:877]
MSYIKGNYRRSIYQNSQGYNIGLFKVMDTDDEKLADYIDHIITFTGYFHELNDMDTYLFYGKLVTHPKYGEQFQVDNYERCKPEEKDSIIEFLTSGLFKGIGEKKAKAIVDVLGKDTLKIILENPDNLILIPGVTKKNIEVLHTKLQEYESSYETILILTELGFSTKDAMIVYNFYKNKTKNIIDTNIYQIIEDIYNMTFKKIDAIALKSGLEKDAPIRVEASIIYIMNELSNAYGHSYYFKEEIASYLQRVLGVNITEELFLSSLENLEKNLLIVKREERYYLKEMYESETLITKRFRMLSREEDIVIKDIDSKIKELENLFGITYNEQQFLAIKNSLLKQFLIITGGPGTGKTTIMKGVTELYRTINKLSYEQLQEKIALLAPTGRAAKRMPESTLLRASTIHRFLKWQKETNKFQVNEYNKSRVEFVIIDEASMIDTYLMASLLKGISANCKILLVGDDHQLPSVGPGQVLHDLIESNSLQKVELTELYRQGKDSNILTLAYDIRQGEVNEEVFNVGDDLTFIKATPDQVVDNVLEITDTYQDLSYKEFQILCPMYKTIAGIDEINRHVQNKVNPKTKNKKELQYGDVIFREDDKVLQLTNMPDENVYNGDIGIIKEIKTAPKKEIIIDFDGNIVKYTPSNFNNFRLAYAISIHKAQGSEFDVVIIPIVRNFNKMLYRKLIYTGITRSKKKLYLIGDINALKYAVSNNNSDIRRTSIKDYLQNGIK